MLCVLEFLEVFCYKVGFVIWLVVRIVFWFWLVSINRCKSCWNYLKFYVIRILLMDNIMVYIKKNEFCKLIREMMGLWSFYNEDNN